VIAPTPSPVSNSNKPNISLSNEYRSTPIGLYFFVYPLLFLLKLKNSQIFHTFGQTICSCPQNSLLLHRLSDKKEKRKEAKELPWQED
jgi:hypothetical protein